MESSHWLTTWLKRHPLKEPAGVDRATYTREVISKIKGLHAPAVSAAPWWQLLLNPAFALATAAVVVLSLTTAVERSRAQLAQRVLHDSALLAALGENGGELPDDDQLADDLEVTDTLVLAESPPSDDQWIQQTMQLIDQLDQDSASDDAATDGSDEDWLNELEMLDEADLNSSTSSSRNTPPAFLRS